MTEEFRIRDLFFSSLISVTGIYRSNRVKQGGMQFSTKNGNLVYRQLYYNTKCFISLIHYFIEFNKISDCNWWLGSHSRLK